MTNMAVAIWTSPSSMKDCHHRSKGLQRAFRYANHSVSCTSALLFCGNKRAASLSGDRVSGRTQPSRATAGWSIGELVRLRSVCGAIDNLRLLELVSAAIPYGSGHSLRILEPAVRFAGVPGSDGLVTSSDDPDDLFDIRWLPVQTVRGVPDTAFKPGETRDAASEIR